MNEEAEYGVCAHYRYKGTDTDISSEAYEEKIAWLRQVLDWHDEVGDLRDLSDALRQDVLEDRITYLPVMVTSLIFRQDRPTGSHIRSQRSDIRVVSES